MQSKTLSILGSTGSIGTNTLDVVARFPGRYRVHALAAHRNVARLAEQVARFKPALAVLFDEEAAAQLATQVPSSTKVLSGMDGLMEAASVPQADLVVAGMVGAAGLRPAYAAIEAGKVVALANKETLVLAGELMLRRAQETGARLLPMDSEHNAIFQCLQGENAADVERIVLTASGGPFRDRDAADFGDITLEEALAHPNWSMGPKITIDSATMMNKGLEVIEARWLFNLPVEQIGVLIHRQSIVHSMVEFQDGSVIAQLGMPDMRTPIAHCLSWPERLPLDLPRLNLAEVGTLDFADVPREKYPCLALALEALKLGSGATAALNGANEVVVAAYLAGEFPFLEIGRILEVVMTGLRSALANASGPACLKSISSVDDAIAADQWGRGVASSAIAGRAQAGHGSDLASQRTASA